MREKDGSSGEMRTSLLINLARDRTVGGGGDGHEQDRRNI